MVGSRDGFIHTSPLMSIWKYCWFLFVHLVYSKHQVTGYTLEISFEGSAKNAFNLLTNLTNSNYLQIMKSQQTTFSFPVLNVGDIMVRRTFHCSPLALFSMESETGSALNTCKVIWKEIMWTISAFIF